MPKFNFLDKSPSADFDFSNVDQHLTPLNDSKFRNSCEQSEKSFTGVFLKPSPMVSKNRNDEIMNEAKKRVDLLKSHVMKLGIPTA